MHSRLYYTDSYEIPLPPGHRFPITKYRILRERLFREGLFSFEAAPTAQVQDLLLAHQPEYVSKFIAGELDPTVMRRIGFPWSEGLVRRSLASVGGTLAATRDALERGWGGNLAGGTHHAFAAEGSGFCVFNDLAIAARWVRSEFDITRAAIVDLDVHQGDGTAAILRDDAAVLTVSVHCAVNFPFRKQESKLDVELPEGAGDLAYLRALDPVLDHVMRFRPQIIFYQSGVDGLAEDKLGKLALSHAGLLERDRRVIEIAKALAIPLVITLGGGYAKPIELTVEAHANTYLLAATLFSSAAKDLRAI